MYASLLSLLPREVQQLAELAPVIHPTVDAALAASSYAMLDDTLHPATPARRTLFIQGRQRAEGPPMLPAKGVATR